MLNRLPQILIASLFLFSGVKGFTNLQGFSSMIASKGLPFAGILAVLVLALKVFGGYSIIVDNQYSHDLIKALIVFMIIATALYHNFINQPAEFMTAFRNIAVIGGLMLLLKTESSTSKTNFIKLFF